MSTVVGPKGQVTIEKEIRELLGVQPGWRAVQRLVGDRVEIRFLPPKHRRSLKGLLGNPHGVRLDTDESFQEAVENAWSSAAWDAAASERERETQA